MDILSAALIVLTIFGVGELKDEYKKKYQFKQDFFVQDQDSMRYTLSCKRPWISSRCRKVARSMCEEIGYQHGVLTEENEAVGTVSIFGKKQDFSHYVVGIECAGDDKGPRKGAVKDLNKSMNTVIITDH